MVSLYTILYEGSKNHILNPSNQFNTCNFELVIEKIIGINNVDLNQDDYLKLKHLNNLGVKTYVIDDYASEMFKFFNLTKPTNTQLAIYLGYI